MYYDKVKRVICGVMAVFNKGESGKRNDRGVIWASVGDRIIGYKPVYTIESWDIEGVPDRVTGMTSAVSGLTSASEVVK